MPCRTPRRRPVSRIPRSAAGAAALTVAAMKSNNSRVLVRTGSVPDGGPYRNMLQLGVVAIRHLSFRSMTSFGSHESAAYVSWSDVRDQLRGRGLRWTPPRRTLMDVLAQTDGPVTGAAIVDRSIAVDPTTTPSTVYRTLDVLEELR